jgi:hypothetical protein
MRTVLIKPHIHTKCLCTVVDIAKVSTFCKSIDNLAKWVQKRSKSALDERLRLVDDCAETHGHWMRSEV